MRPCVARKRDSTGCLAAHESGGKSEICGDPQSPSGPARIEVEGDARTCPCVGLCGGTRRAARHTARSGSQPPPVLEGQFVKVGWEPVDNNWIAFRTPECGGSRFVKLLREPANAEFCGTGSGSPWEQERAANFFFAVKLSFNRCRPYRALADPNHKSRRSRSTTGAEDEWVRSCDIMRSFSVSAGPGQPGVNRAGPAPMYRPATFRISLVISYVLAALLTTHWKTTLRRYEPGSVVPLEGLPSDGRPAWLSTRFACCHALSGSRSAAPIGFRVAPPI